MSFVIKKCFNCRIDLPESNNGATQCEKCQKNEAKYGKPTTCQFCQLNAAFHEKKCVYCSYSERKFGKPVICANCKLGSAFPKNEKARKNGSLCRLCIMQARASKQSVLAGISVPEHHERKEGASSSHKHAHKKRKSEKPAVDPAAKTLKTELLIEPIPAVEGKSLMQLQQLRDQIARLNSLIQAKENIILEKDKVITALRADIYGMEKKHREKLQQLQREKEEQLESVIDKWQKEKKK